MPKGVFKRKPRSEEHKRNLSLAMKGKTPYNKGKKSPQTSNEKNPAWKGEGASYAAKHMWVRSKFGSPMQCEDCKEEFTNTYKIHWANISGEYKRERSDWKRLCIICHKRFDNFSFKIQQAIKDGRIRIVRGRFSSKSIDNA